MGVLHQERDARLEAPRLSVARGDLDRTPEAEVELAPGAGWRSLIQPGGPVTKRKRAASVGAEARSGAAGGAKSTSSNSISISSKWLSP
jgi:hypothetical protein